MSSEAYFLEEADSHIQANLDDAVVQEALKSGVDLREYSKQVEDELKVVENDSIEGYIEQSQNIASLHNQIGKCPRIETTFSNKAKATITYLTRPVFLFSKLSNQNYSSIV